MMTRSIAAALVLAATAACSGPKGGAQDTGYAQDADTGAAAPATESGITPMQPPDSTTGVASPTGRPGVAGVPQARSSDVAAPDGKNPRP